MGTRYSSSAVTRSLSNTVQREIILSIYACGTWLYQREIIRQFTIKFVDVLFEPETKTEMGIENKSIKPIQKNNTKKQTKPDTSCIYIMCV